MRKLVLACFFVFGYLVSNAQDVSIDNLKSMKADKQATLDALAGEIADLDKQINEFPGWKIGGVGVLGFNLNSNSNWFAAPFSNSNTRGGGITASAFANQDQPKYFWRNLLSANLTSGITTRNTDLDESFDDINKVDNLVDVLELTSLAGYKLTDKWALSAEGRYNSQILTFNAPGKAVLSAGATWLPINNLVVVIHPLGYEINWPGDFVSSFGAKIGATYAATILPGVAWSTNLNAFLPYGGGDATFSQHPTTDGEPRGDIGTTFELGEDAIAGSERVTPFSGGDLTNWIWNNTFSTNIFKGIGVGFNIGLRNDKQIATQYQYERALDLGTTNIEDFDNPLQVFYSLGLSYTL